jgi:hypothetical protein
MGLCSDLISFSTKRQCTATRYFFSVELCEKAIGALLASTLSVSRRVQAATKAKQLEIRAE